MALNFWASSGDQPADAARLQSGGQRGRSPDGPK